jgi:hypothetical protein
MLTSWAKRRERPRGPKAQESKRPYLELTPRGAYRRVQLFRWDEPAGAPVRSPTGFCRKAQERKREFERVHGPRERNKALKGEAQERWRLKKTAKVLRNPNHREGSQTLRVALLESRVTLFRRFPIKGSDKKGP